MIRESASRTWQNLGLIKNEPHLAFTLQKSTSNHTTPSALDTSTVGAVCHSVTPLLLPSLAFTSIFCLEQFLCTVWLAVHHYARVSFYVVFYYFSAPREQTSVK